jgi:hypothetical protein
MTNMFKFCFHKWISWSGLCNDWAGFVEARVCTKCLKYQQQSGRGKWYTMGYLDPVEDKAIVDDINELYCGEVLIKDL